MRKLKYFHILQDLSFEHIELALGCSQRQLNLEQTPFYAPQIFLLTCFLGMAAMPIPLCCSYDLYEDSLAGMIKQ